MEKHICEICAKEIKDITYQCNDCVCYTLCGNCYIIEKEKHAFGKHKFKELKPNTSSPVKQPKPQNGRQPTYNLYSQMRMMSSQNGRKSYQDDSSDS